MAASRSEEQQPGARVFALDSMAAMVALIGSTKSWCVLVGAVVVFGLLALGRVMWRHERAQQAIETILTRSGAIVFVGLVVLAILVDTPWMSRERIETNDGAVTGYPVRVQPGFVTVLTEDREIEIVLTSDITGRKILD